MNRDIDQSLSEVEREIRVRLKCFDRWVGEGKLSWVDAFDRLERLISAVQHLRDYQTQLKIAELNAITPGDQPGTDGTNTIPFTAATPTTATEAPQSELPRKIGA